MILPWVLTLAALGLIILMGYGLEIAFRKVPEWISVLLLLTPALVLLAFVIHNLIEYQLTGK